MLRTDLDGLAWIIYYVIIIFIYLLFAGISVYSRYLYLSTTRNICGQNILLARMTTFNDLFGPMGDEFCLYFYILAVIKLVFFFMIIAGIIYTGIRKKLGPEFYFLSILLSFGYLLSYLENRLLFNMCGNSLN